ncbi:MAG: ABC transporter substrate-binding protein, partial [Burkholderiales bacterium]|nr:ABC transporter substrate-binding protein [Burkholderiales bacterium]
MFETLGVLSADEPQSVYGLLAESFQVAPDFSYVTIRLNPKARFYNGDPVTAADVKYSFDSMTGPHASPSFADPINGVASARVLDTQTVRFDFKKQTADTVFALFCNLPIFSHKWGMTADGKHKDFDQIVDEYPITSGPYTIAKVDSGRRIEFARNPNYWARDLPVRKGFFNFDRVVYRFYEDEDIVLEAFKAGEFDITIEYSAGHWARLYQGRQFDDGRILKRAFPEQMVQGYQAYNLNLRRPLFQDPRVREALNYSFDFSRFDTDTYHQYVRIGSLFPASEYAATGMPTAGELALLEPYRKQLDPAVFGPAYVNPDAGKQSVGLRANLLKARDLL